MSEPMPPGAWALSIETSNPSSHAGASSVAGVVAPEAGGTIADAWVAEEVFSAGSRHDDGLMPAIERVRVRLGVRAADLHLVCVSAGPGGYTGLRVAATTGMLLAAATGAKVVAVPSALVVAETAGVTEAFGVCLASKREFTHATLFKFHLKEWSSEAVGLIDSGGLEGLGVRIVYADEHLPASIRLRANDLGIMIREPRFSAAACLRVGLGRSPSADGVVSPLYGREPEAVRLWRARDPRSGS